MKGGLGFALDVNNGLVALSYSAPPALMTSFSITKSAAVAGPGFIFTWTSVPGYTYQVQVSTNLSVPGGGWNNLGSPISAGGTTTSYTDTTDAGLSSAYYRVIGY